MPVCRSPQYMLFAAFGRTYSVKLCRKKCFFGTFLDLVYAERLAAKRIQKRKTSMQLQIISAPRCAGCSMRLVTLVETLHVLHLVRKPTQDLDF